MLILMTNITVLAHEAHHIECCYYGILNVASVVMITCSPHWLSEPECGTCRVQHDMNSIVVDWQSIVMVMLLQIPCDTQQHLSHNC